MLMSTVNSVKVVYTERHIDISLEPEFEQRSQVKLFTQMFVVRFAVHSQNIDILFCSKMITAVFDLCTS